MSVCNEEFRCWVQLELNTRQLGGYAHVTLDFSVRLNLASMWCATWEKKLVFRVGMKSAVTQTFIYPLLRLVTWMVSELKSSALAVLTWPWLIDRWQFVHNYYCIIYTARRVCQRPLNFVSRLSTRISSRQHGSHVVRPWRRCA